MNQMNQQPAVESTIEAAAYNDSDDSLYNEQQDREEQRYAASQVRSSRLRNTRYALAAYE